MDDNQIKKSSSINSEDINDLKEILEIEKLSRLLEQFYSATGLSNFIMDLKGNILHEVGWKSICMEFHRKHKVSSERCLKSDTILANRLKKKEKYSIYICQNGMVDVAIPIIIDGVHVANFFIGQFFFETPDKDFFIKQAEELGFDKEKYMKALEECHVYNKETILRYLDFFIGLINMIGESALKTINQKKQVAEITNKEKRTAELIIDKEQAEVENAVISKAEKYNRSLIEASLDPLVTIGPNGIITDVNTATENATGLLREKLIGTVFSEYFTEPGKAQAGYQQVFKDGKVFDYELNLKHISGYSIPVLYNASVYKDDEGEIIGVFAAARDITTIRKAEDELIYLKNNLESANRELEAFSYSVSHDLKAPLRHITGYISLLVKKYIDLLPEEGRHYLDNISFSAKNMGELIDGLLQFSRTGRIDMNQRLLDINGIVDTLIQPIKEEDTERRIEWDINPMPLAFGDFDMIKSVWSNLIENAVKFTKNKDLAKITIGAEENEKDTIYYIKDNGAGFDMNYATKLFAVFQRLHSREDYDGTGIGLATVQRIITRHGGKTWAEGKVGEGATFYFSLIKRKESE